MKRQDLVNIGLLVNEHKIYDHSETEVYISYLGIVNISKLTMLDLFKRLAEEQQKIGKEIGKCELQSKLKDLLGIEVI